MIFVESYFERSLKQNVFDKLADDNSTRLDGKQLEKCRVNALAFKTPPVFLFSIP